MVSFPECHNFALILTVFEKHMKNHETRILVVDDEPDVLEFLKYNLNKEGFKVATTQNGKSVIEKARNLHPQLILLDIMMPGMDGMETCRILREDPKFKETLIAFLTARNEDYSQIAGLETGAGDYITKPVKPRLLIIEEKKIMG